MSLVFVTGGSRGLGFATASALKQQGYDLVLFAKDETRLKDAAAKLGASYEVVDLEENSKTREVFKSAVEKFGVSGWDRYGRFVRFKNRVKEADEIKNDVLQALDALAAVHTDLQIQPILWQPTQVTLQMVRL